jgi:hypothetical protein
MTCRSPRATEDIGPPDDPTIVVESGLNGATGFETSDRKIRCVDPDDLLSVLRSLERETVMPHHSRKVPRCYIRWRRRSHSRMIGPTRKRA